MASYRQFAIDLVHQAGALLKGRFQYTGTPATLKPDRSFVTAVDFEADQLIAQAINRYAPDEKLLTEEMHTRLDTVEPALWIVDPLDGTTNYSLGMNIWGISIARLEKGLPTLGVVYFPLSDELYVAEAGHGATCNGTPAHVRLPDPQQPWPFFVCCSRTFRRYNITIPYKPRILGSAAYNFCQLARGTAVVAFEATPKIWDLAAVWLLVQEAGGVVTTLHGQPPFPIIPDRDHTKTSYPTLAAASPDILASSIQQIQPKPKYQQNIL